MFREKLSERFVYEGRIGKFNQFVVFSAYFDESGNRASKRIAVVGAIATAESWTAFETHWALVLSAAKRERQFHAKNTDRVQIILNELLADAMKYSNVWAMSVVVDEADYLRTTNQRQRSQMGNAYGFAGYIGLSVLSDWARQSNEHVGYYIDQGGPGYGKMMEILVNAYATDSGRESFRVAGYGPADRRIHLPVHPADLVAHELAMNPDDSKPLAILGDRVRRIDVTPEFLRGLMAEFDELVRHFKWKKLQNKRAGKKR